jgi:hypothetical protein
MIAFEMASLRHAVQVLLAVRRAPGPTDDLAHFALLDPG